MSQAQLARATNGAITDGHIAQIEAGGRNASAQKIGAIAKALNLSAKEREELVALAFSDSVELGRRQRDARAAATKPVSAADAALSGVSLPDDLDDTELALLQAVADSLWAKRQGRKK